MEDLTVSETIICMSFSESKKFFAFVKIVKINCCVPKHLKWARLIRLMNKQIIYFINAVKKRHKQVHSYSSFCFGQNCIFIILSGEATMSDSVLLRMDWWLAILRPFNSISVISGRCLDDNERLCAMELRLRLRRFRLEWGSNFVR